MNVLDRLDQQVRAIAQISDHDGEVEVSVAHLRALLDVARAAHEVVAERQILDLAEPSAALIAALAPLLEDTGD